MGCRIQEERVVPLPVDARVLQRKRCEVALRGKGAEMQPRKSKREKQRMKSISPFSQHYGTFPSSISNANCRSTQWSAAMRAARGGRRLPHRACCRSVAARCLNVLTPSLSGADPCASTVARVGLSRAQQLCAQDLSQCAHIAL